MDSIKYLIGFFIKIAFALFFVALIWWLVSILDPSFSLRALLKSSTNASSTSQGASDWLPSPRQYSSLFGRKVVTQNSTTNLYVAPPPFNGYSLDNNQYSYTSYNYITYAQSGDPVVTTTSKNQAVTAPTRIQKPPQGELPAQSPNSLINSRSLSVRNLSIYEGGHVYTGLSFIGEAKSTMYRDGKFPIVVVDQAGKVVGVSAGVATTDWTIPGWTRFQTKVQYVLPNNTPCTMVFEEALTQAERATRQPLRVPLPVRCN